MGNTSSQHFNSVLGKIPAAFLFDETMRGKRPPIALNNEMMELFSNNSITSITQKSDGENHAVLNVRGVPTLCIRRDVPKGKEPPPGWIQTHEAQGTHNIGYMPLSIDEPSHKWALGCFKMNDDGTKNFNELLVLVKNEEGNYEPKYIDIACLVNYSMELMGPKIQQNKDNIPFNCFIIHGSIDAKNFPNLMEFSDFPSLIQSINDWFDVINIEGVVICFSDKSMFKLTQNMLGRKWTKRSIPLLEDNF
jgi:hypothetical protein